MNRIKEVKRSIFVFLLFAMVFCLGKQKAYARENLKAGDIFYTKQVKCRVLTPSTWSVRGTLGNQLNRGGTAEVIGVNPDAAPQYLTISYLECCEETQEVFQLVSVKKNAFKNNKKITSITFNFGEDNPERIIHLKKGCFQNCSNLQLISMNCSITAEKNAFAGCKKLKTFTYAEKPNFNFKKGSLKGVKNVLVQTYQSNRMSETAQNFAKALKKGGAKRIHYYYYNRNKILK